MSADVSSPAPTPPDATPHPRAGILQWLAIGIAGAGFAFVASAHLPDGIKFPGVLTMGLGALVGWGWGQLGKSLEISPSKGLAVIVWIVLAGAELLGTWKHHQDRADYLRVKWQALQNDPIALVVRDALTQEPENETVEARKERLQRLADLDESDAIRARRLEFRGYLKSRMERLKIRALTIGMWPEIVWGIEVLLGSTLGAWLALAVLRQRLPSNP